MGFLDPARYSSKNLAKSEIYEKLDEETKQADRNNSLCKKWGNRLFPSSLRKISM